MTPARASDPIFEPLTINGLRFKNRIVRSSLGGRLDYYEGSMSEARVAWERRFAKGGVSVIISSNAGVRNDGAIVPGFALIDHDRTIPSWARLVNEVRRHDCRYVVQLFFAGRQRDLARRDARGNRPPSATDRPDLMHGLRARRMTATEISGVVDAFGRAARRAREAGADGVEIHSCNGYLLHQFLSSAINDRVDAYGGELRSRARALLEVVGAVRAAVGRDFFVSAKLSAIDDHAATTYPFVRHPGNTIGDTTEVARWLADAGVDAIHLSQGDSFPHPRLPAGPLPVEELRREYAPLYHEGRLDPWVFFLLQFAATRRALAWTWLRRMPFYRKGVVVPALVEGMNQWYAQTIGTASRLPVICVGGWQTAKPIREALRAGRCAAVSIARGLLANPDLVRLFEQGREGPERPCTYCNKCVANTLQHPLACYDPSRFESAEQMYEEAYRVFRDAVEAGRDA